ncbi:MAG: DUF2064 domain-containing protein [Kiritimatiellae bacterium]|nr:DUF2064 domain-containing protein [Kiritimatiellia bacterium]
MRMKISVIIPVLNDASYLTETLKSLAPYQDELEIIVVDGGEAEGSLKNAQAYSEIHMIRSSPGRAIQMNAGAKLATGNILLFLHSDTLLTGDWPSAVIAACTQPRFAIGAFRFTLNHPHIIYRFIEIGVHIRSRFLRLPYGDQALFLKAKEFERIGGYPSIPIMEEVELVLRQRKYGRLILLPYQAISSVRNWERDGIWKRMTRNIRTLIHYTRGVSPEKLVSFYRGTEKAIILFCKNPEPGKVKTRLAATIGHEQASHIYKQMVLETIRTAQTCTGHPYVFIFYSPPESEPLIKEWIGDEKTYIPQSEGDLGERMSDAFKSLFSMGFKQIIIIGTDCPAISRKHLSQGFTALNRNDIVLGPTHDGGYYLLGMKRHHPELFEHMPWSTPSVLDKTQKAINHLKLSYQLLAILRDVDDQHDLDYYESNGVAFEKKNLTEG